MSRRGPQGIHYLCALRCRAVPNFGDPLRRNCDLRGEAPGTEQALTTSSCDFRFIWDSKTVGTSSQWDWDKVIQCVGGDEVGGEARGRVVVGGSHH